MEGSPRLHPRSKLRGIRRRRIKLACLQSLHEPFPFFELFDEHLSHEIAGLDDLRIGNPIVNIQAFSTSHDNPLLTQDAEMLRNIGFGKAQTTNDLANCQFFIPERLDDPKALRMRKNLADFGVVLKERCVDLSARHEDNLLFQSFELSQLSDIHMPVSTLHRS